MNILIVGSGGREHALGWKIKQSNKTGKLYFAPGNAGTAETGENIPVGVSDFEGIKNIILTKKIGMVVVGPEIPLVEGIHDFIASVKDLKKVKVVGPKRSGAQLEGSKNFAKEFMKKYRIPTAGYITVTKKTVSEGYDFLKTQKPPYVLKADGPAAGKGVLIVDSINEAKQLLTEILEGKFGDAGKKVVIEEFLSGVEVSVFVVTDGKDYKILPEAKDYKRIGEGDTDRNRPQHGWHGCNLPGTVCRTGIYVKSGNTYYPKNNQGNTRRKTGIQRFYLFRIDQRRWRTLCNRVQCQNGGP